MLASVPETEYVWPRRPGRTAGPVIQRFSFAMRRGRAVTAACPGISLPAFADRVEGLEPADVDPPVGDGRRGGGLVGQPVLGQPLERRPGLHHRHDSVPGGRIYLTVGVDRRGAVPGRVDRLVVLLLACLGVQADQEA